MKSKAPGKPALDIEVTNISRHEFRILAKVELQGPDHPYRPDLGVDLSLESVRSPEKYPLVSI